jgi:hypothetical protein
MSRLLLPLRPLDDASINAQARTPFLPIMQASAGGAAVDGRTEVL